MATAKEIAEWMVEQVANGKYLYQESVAHNIALTFGKEFTYHNNNGNLAIGKNVLKEFRKLTEGTVIWIKGERAWRLRNPHDKPGRQQE